MSLSIENVERKEKKFKTNKQNIFGGMSKCFSLIFTSSLVIIVRPLEAECIASGGHIQGGVGVN